MLLKCIALVSPLEREVTEAIAQELVTRHSSKHVVTGEEGAHRLSLCTSSLLEIGVKAWGKFSFLLRETHLDIQTNQREPCPICSHSSGGCNEVASERPGRSFHTTH